MKQSMSMLPGGAPVINDYLSEAQDGIVTALNQLAKGFGPAYFLKGCAISNDGSTWSITAGWAFFNGELMRVPAHSWEDAASFAANSFAYVEVVAVENPVSFANGNNYDLTRENVLKFKEHDAEPDPVYLLSFKSFGQAIGQALKGLFTEKTAIPDHGVELSAWAYDDAGDHFSAELTIDGRLILKGQINASTGHSATVNGIPYCVLLCTFDEDYRPSRNINFNVCDNSVDYSAPYVTPQLGPKYVLFTDGKLCLRQGNTPADHTIIFDNEVIQLS